MRGVAARAIAVLAFCLGLMACAGDHGRSIVVVNPCSVDVTVEFYVLLDEQVEPPPTARTDAELTVAGVSESGVTASNRTRYFVSIDAGQQTLHVDPGDSEVRIEIDLCQ